MGYRTIRALLAAIIGAHLCFTDPHSLLLVSPSWAQRDKIDTPCAKSTPLENLSIHMGKKYLVILLGHGSPYLNSSRSQGPLRTEWCKKYAGLCVQRREYQDVYFTLRSTLFAVAALQRAVDIGLKVHIKFWKKINISHKQTKKSGLNKICFCVQCRGPHFLRL